MESKEKKIVQVAVKYEIEVPSDATDLEIEKILDETFEGKEYLWSDDKKRDILDLGY